MCERGERVERVEYDVSSLLARAVVFKPPYFEVVQDLHRVACRHLELQQLLVALLDLLNILLVLNLQLVKVNVVQHIAHLLLLEAKTHHTVE